MKNNPNGSPNATGEYSRANGIRLSVIHENSVSDAIDARTMSSREIADNLRSIITLPYARITACMDPILPCAPFWSDERPSQIVVVMPAHTLYMAAFRLLLSAERQRLTSFGPGVLRIEPDPFTRHERTIITGFLDDGKVHPAGDPTGWGDAYLRALLGGVERVTIEPRTARFVDRMWAGRPTHAARSIRIICHRRFVKKWTEAARLHAPAAELLVLAGQAGHKRLEQGR
jgi:hypothetical protein